MGFIRRLCRCFRRAEAHTHGHRKDREDSERSGENRLSPAVAALHIYGEKKKSRLEGKAALSSAQRAVFFSAFTFQERYPPRSCSPSRDWPDSSCASLAIASSNVVSSLWRLRRGGGLTAPRGGGGSATANRPSSCPAELFCMGFSFAAFFFFVLVTRTADLDYDSERRSPISPLCFLKMSEVAQAPVFLPPPPSLADSSPGPVGGDWRAGRGGPVDELVALRFRHGLRGRGGLDAGLPPGLCRPLHSSRWGTKNDFQATTSGQINVTKKLRLTFFSLFCGLSSGDLDVFRRSDVVFWVTFCSITLVVPLFFVRWPREVKSDSAAT